MLTLAACGAPDAAVPDAPRSTVPTSPAGTFDVTSAIDLPVPAAAAPVLAILSGLGDDPDDPSRFVLDRVIDRLPDGALKTLAAGAAPYLAAYLNTQLATVAPDLVTGLHGLSDGLSRIADHVATRETWTIDDAGHTTRAITRFVFDVAGHATEVGLADAGLAAPKVTTQAQLAQGARLVIAEHVQPIAYGSWLRLGLERAVVPAVVPAATDLAAALTALVDCDGLAAVLAARLAVGAPGVYATACRAAMTYLAGQVDAELAAIDQVAMTLELAGDANALDDDGDGAADRLTAGSWVGTLHAAVDETIGAAQFTGVRQP
ncbi:MAG TPA: hypothetical protein VFP84_09455 [Kofleriaceae bacterium]|nr:hypothetical protein [Kofleriaceae bacterium]